MNPFFIHTIELSYRSDFEDIHHRTKNLRLMNDGGEYKSLQYTDLGITVVSRECKKESKDGKGNYKMSLIVNPSRLLQEGTYINQITSREELDTALGNLGVLIEKIFRDLTLDDFKLSRIDITKDIHGIPEMIIQEYILIMRRMALSYGFKLNSELEKNTPEFRCEDSFNVKSKSQGAEFVVYNKHRAAVDQGYPEKVLKHFENTMRVEFRCQRRYINKHTKHLDTKDAILEMYDYSEFFVERYYREMFRYRTDLCYVSPSWQRKFIQKQFCDKKMGMKLMKLLEEMEDEGMNLDIALYECYLSKNSITKKLSAFNTMGFSPIPISLCKVSYMSSLDKILGFGNGNFTKKCYKRIKHCKGRKKVIFEYEP